MKTANEELEDALIRHQTYLLRYSGGLRKRAETFLNNSEVDIAKSVREILRNYPPFSKPKAWEKLSSVNKTLKEIRKQSWNQVYSLVSQELIELSVAEPAMLANIVNTVSPVVLATITPAPRLLRAIVTEQPFEGALLRQHTEDLAAADVKRMSAAVKHGMTFGEDVDTIVRRLVGTKALYGADGETELTRSNVRSLIRTGVQHVAGSARRQWFNDNKDILEKERFVATLDSKTTPRCKALDGDLFDVGEGPLPPLHFNCRSLLIAYFDGVLVGNRPANPTTERLLVKDFAKLNGLGNITSREALPRGYKVAFDSWSTKKKWELIGPIPAKKTYQTWLEGQSAAFQNDTLGETKGLLFRKGGLTLKQFVNRNGDELTLFELARKHKDAFKAAGLDPSAF